MLFEKDEKTGVLSIGASLGAFAFGGKPFGIHFMLWRLGGGILFGVEKDEHPGFKKEIDEDGITYVDITLWPVMFSFVLFPKTEA